MVSDTIGPSREEASDDDPVPKIRVFWSDGTGTALWDQRRVTNDRTWYAPPAAEYTESLFVSENGLILRCFRSKRPQLTGSADRGDLFDAESYAIHYTPAEAVEWLRRNGYEIPADLRGDSRPQADQVGSVQIIQNVEQMTVRQLNQTNSNLGDVNNAIQSD
jgi:hypothetical protein